MADNIEPVTRLEKIIAGEDIEPVTRLEKIIALYGTGGSGGTGGTTNYNDLLNKPSINGVELSGNKSLSDLGIINYDDTAIKSDITDLQTDKQDKTDNTLDTTDKTVVGAINEINGNALDNVGFSSDYKNIIINRKSGLNPYTIPISSIIHNAKITELNDVDSTNIGDGKTLVYDSATQKHKYVDSTGTDELVKMDSTSTAKYLEDLIDKTTIVNDNGKLVAKTLDGLTTSITELNYIKGLQMPVQDLVTAFANGGLKTIDTPFPTYADLQSYDVSVLLDDIRYLVRVLADETHGGKITAYLIKKGQTAPTFYGYLSDSRNFTINPIDLVNEITGKLKAKNIDVDDLFALLTLNDTYKTATVKDEIFGTHGAKAMYDELVADIGNKANTTDLDTHTTDTDIHVSTTEKDTWNTVSKKANKTDLDTHINDTVAHMTQSEKDSYVKKTDITDTIDSTSTSTNIPSAKGVYDNAIKDKNLKTYSEISQLGLTYPITVGEIFNAMPEHSMAHLMADNRSVITDCPTTNGILIIDKCYPSKFSIEFKVSASGEVTGNTLYIGQLKGSDASGLTWSKLATESQITELKSKHFAGLICRSDTFDLTQFGYPNTATSLAGIVMYISVYTTSSHGFYLCHFPLEDRYCFSYYLGGGADIASFTKDGSKITVTSKTPTSTISSIHGVLLGCN